MKNTITIGLIALATVATVTVGVMAFNTTDTTQTVTNATVATNTTIDADYTLTESITITEGGAHVITGTITDGQIVVDADDEDVVLILNGVDITNDSGAAIYIASAGNVIIDLAEGSTNLLTQTGLDTDEEEKAALYSTSDLIITGEADARLIVESTVADGVSSNDDLTIEATTVMVDSADDGVRGKDSVTLDGATVTIVAADDGLKSSNEEEADRGWVYITGSELTITAGDDGIKAETEVTIDSGVVTILESYEGIEGFDITLTGGSITINSIDDGINVTDGNSASGSNGEVTAGRPVDEVIEGLLTLGGATVVINSESDGLDSNGNAVMTDGLVIVNGPTTDREGAIDYNGTFEISGGTLIAVGAVRMSQAPSDISSQYTLSVNFDSLLAAGTRVTIVDDTTSEVMMSFVPEKTFQSIVYSSDQLVSGNDYSIYTEGTVTGAETHGLTTDTSFSDGALFTTLTIGSIVTSYGAIVQGGGRGGIVPTDGDVPIEGERQVRPEGTESAVGERPLPPEGADVLNAERPTGRPVR
jgi:hypothetical protein